MVAASLLSAGIRKKNGKVVKILVKEGVAVKNIRLSY